MIMLIILKFVKSYKLLPFFTIEILKYAFLYLNSNILIVQDDSGLKSETKLLHSIRKCVRIKTNAFDLKKPNEFL